MWVPSWSSLVVSKPVKGSRKHFPEKGFPEMVAGKGAVVELPGGTDTTKGSRKGFPERVPGAHD